MIRALLLLLSLAAPLHADKFYPLFAENTLSGWDTFGTAKWTMKDGVLTGGRTAIPNAGASSRPRHFKDFELTLDFKIDEHGKYNSGVFHVAHEEGIGPAYQINIGRGAARRRWDCISTNGYTRATKKTLSANRANGTGSASAQSALHSGLAQRKIHRRFHPQEPTCLSPQARPNCPPNLRRRRPRRLVQFRRMQIIERKEQ